MKTLVIGCGSIGQRHIRNLTFLKAGPILAFDIDKRKLKEVKEICSSLIASDKLDNLWKEEPQVAFIAVPTALHIKYALEAAKRSCHLFIEKPLSHNTEKVDELIDVVNQKKIATFLGYNFRFNDCIAMIKKLLKKKIIGRVINARTHFGSYLPERHPGKDYHSDYGGKKCLGGGVILDAISHHLDLLIFLFGRPKEIFGYSCKRSRLEIDVEDTADVLLKFSGGEVVSVHANFIQRPYKNTFELIGEKGTIFCDFIKDILKYYDINKGKWNTYYGNNDPNLIYLKEIRHFIKCVEKKASPPVDVVSGKQELEILMKIKKSSSIRKWVEI